jgi:two-component SAPR family response regulator
LFLVALILAGCGNAQQKSAYEHAFAAEQQHQQITAEEVAALIREYQGVIHLEPDSAWAKKARERITALQTRANTDETHKSVFQEHGVD